MRSRRNEQRDGQPPDPQSIGLDSASAAAAQGTDQHGTNAQGIHQHGINLQGIHQHGTNAQGILQGIIGQGTNPHGISAQSILQGMGIIAQGINPLGIIAHQGINIHPQGAQFTVPRRPTTPIAQPSTPPHMIAPALFQAASAAANSWLHGGGGAPCIPNGPRPPSGPPPDHIRGPVLSKAAGGPPPQPGTPVPKAPFQAVVVRPYAPY